MANKYYNNPVDPIDGFTIPEYHSVISTGYYSGTYDPIVADTTDNFPVETPDRFFVDFPQVIDQSDLYGTRPALFRNETDGVAGTGIELTQVFAIVGDNQIILPNPNGTRSHSCEVSKNLKTKSIGYSYSGLGSPIDAKYANDPILQTITVEDTAYFPNDIEGAAFSVDGENKILSSDFAINCATVQQSAYILMTFSGAGSMDMIFEKPMMCLKGRFSGGSGTLGIVDSTNGVGFPAMFSTSLFSYSTSAITSSGSAYNFMLFGGVRFTATAASSLAIDINGVFGQGTGTGTGELIKSWVTKVSETVSVAVTVNTVLITI